MRQARTKVRATVKIDPTHFLPFIFKQIRRPLVKARQIQFWCLVVFLLAVAAVWLTPSQSSSASAEAKSPFKKLIDVRARLATRETRTYRLPTISAGKVYSLLVSAPSPATFGSNDTLQVTLRGGGKTIAGKSLQIGR